VGETVARKLARHYKSIDGLMAASEEQLVQVDEIGEKIAHSVVTFFENEKNLQTVGRLRAYGIQLKLSEKDLAGRSDKLSGMTFVVSGVFEMVSRNELKKLIEDNGGRVSGSISGKTSFLVAGDKMGPSKQQKADSLEVPIISEQDFLQMIA